MPSASSLSIQDTTVVAGDALAGHAILDTVLARKERIEAVGISITGSVETIVRTVLKGSGGRSAHYKECRSLFSVERILWQREEAPQIPEDGLLSLPFYVELDANLPPSFHAVSAIKSLGMVRYSIVTFEERPGRARRLVQPACIIAMVPLGLPAHIELRNAFMNDRVPFLWRSHAQSKTIRNRMFGNTCVAEIEVQLPDLPAFPLGTPIPLQLIITTRTGPVAKSLASKDQLNMFPRPPKNPKIVDFRVCRSVTVVAQGAKTTFSESVTRLPGFGSAQPVPREEGFTIVEEEPTWIPVADALNQEGQSSISLRDSLNRDQPRKMICERRITFKSSLILTCSPTFLLDTIQVSYFIYVRVPFPGVGNYLSSKIPLCLVSTARVLNRNTPAPDYRSDTSSHLDLPPEYWVVALAEGEVPS